LKILALVLFLLAVAAPGCKKADPPWPRIVVTPTYIEAGMPNLRTKITLKDGDVPQDARDGTYVEKPNVVPLVAPLKFRLQKVAELQKRDGIYTGKVTIIVNRYCTFWLNQQVVETAVASGFPKLDVVITP
jgi:hypothetical protein